MMKRLWQTRLRWLLLLLMVALIAACGDEDPAPSTREPTVQPTEEIVQLPSATPSPSVTPGGPTLTPLPTFPPTVTPGPSNTPPPAATNVPPTDTPGPHVHRVVEGETCGSIALRYGLEFVGGAAAIEQANGINCRNLQINQELVVPRPTGTPTPPGLDATETAITTALPPSLRGVTPFAIYEYCPVEDDTLTSIALKTGTTQQRLCELNPLPDGLDCRGCDFSESSVGFCPTPPLISTSRCLSVPGPTHTPTATSTFTGDETSTPTPTFAPPQAIQPANGATMRGAVQLVWLSAGRLRAGEYYQIMIQDAEASETHFAVTRSTNYTVPAQFRPAAGQSRTIQWSVQVVQHNESGLYIPISGNPPLYRFVWEG